MTYDGIAKFVVKGWDSNYAIPIGTYEFPIKITPPAWVSLGEWRRFRLFGYGWNETVRRSLHVFDAGLVDCITAILPVPSRT